MRKPAIYALALWGATVSANEYQWFLFQDLAEVPKTQSVSLETPLKLRQTHRSEFESSTPPTLQPEPDGLEMVDYRAIALFAPAKQDSL